MLRNATKLCYASGMKTLIAAVFAFGLMFAATCPVDDKAGYFTGNTKVVSGVLMKEYKCPMGHSYWSRT